MFLSCTQHGASCGMYFAISLVLLSITLICHPDICLVACPSESITVLTCHKPHRNYIINSGPWTSAISCYEPSGIMCNIQRIVTFALSMHTLSSSTVSATTIRSNCSGSFYSPKSVTRIPSAPRKYRQLHPFSRQSQVSLHTHHLDTMTYFHHMLSNPLFTFFVLS